LRLRSTNGAHPATFPLPGCGAAGCSTGKLNFDQDQSSAR
jgi:hypothetical protein